MHCRQGSRARPFLSLARAAAIGALRAREDATRGKDENVPVRELLFELAGQTWLDFVEAREEGNGDEDDDGFLAVADFDLEQWAYS